MNNDVFGTHLMKTIKNQIKMKVRVSLCTSLCLIQINAWKLINFQHHRVSLFHLYFGIWAVNPEYKHFDVFKTSFLENLEINYNIEIV